MMPSNRLSAPVQVSVAAPTPSGPTSPEGVFSSPAGSIFRPGATAETVAALVTPPLSPMGGTFRGFQGVSQC